MNDEYRSRRAAERVTAEGLGKGRRRLTNDERRRHLGHDESPSESRRRARRMIDEQFADPRAKKVQVSWSFGKRKVK